MTDAVVLAALLGGVGGIVLTLLLILARRFARGASGLGSEAEEATYRALHQASLAAPHLRGGLAGADVGRISTLLSSIAEDVADLTPRLESVRSAAREQAEGAGQISEAMLLLDRSASSSRETLDEFRAATRSLQDAVASLRAEVGRLQVDP